MSNRFLVNPGTSQTWEIQLRPGQNRLGRGEDNDFVINHPSISTHHCEINVSATAVIIKDLGSTNGTFVERVPVTEFTIQNGQHVQFGAVDTLFESSLAPVLPEPVNQPAAGARIVVANPGPAAPPPPPPPPPVSTGGGLRINRPVAHAAPSSQPPAATQASAAPRPMAPVTRRPKTHEEFQRERAATDRKMFVRGLVGALLGGLVGMFGWYMLIRLTHMEIGYAAIMVGACTGAGARLLARQGSSLQGIICAICAVIAIVGGEYFAIQAIENTDAKWELGREYEKKLKWAKSGVEATNHDEIVYFLSLRDEVNSGSIGDEDVKEFLQKDQPRYRDMVNGKPSKDEYVAQELARLPQPGILDNIGLFTILWGVLGIAAAWRIGSGNEG